jgi:hypothetical protein
MAICSLISPFALCFPCFFLFLISTSRHNTTNFLSLTQQQQQPYTPEQQQQQPYIPEQQQQQQQPLPLLKFHPKQVTNKNKMKRIMKILHINIFYDKTTTSQQNSD